MNSGKPTCPCRLLSRLVRPLLSSAYPRTTTPAGPSSRNECDPSSRTMAGMRGTISASRSRLLQFPVEISSNFDGRPRSRCESTKSASLVTTTRRSRSARSLIYSSVVRFTSGKSSVWMASQPAAASHAVIRRGSCASTRKFMASLSGDGGSGQGGQRTPERPAGPHAQGLRSRPEPR